MLGFLAGGGSGAPLGYALSLELLTSSGLTGPGQGSGDKASTSRHHLLPWIMGDRDAASE